ncbi:TPA: hypothetical protein ACJMKJ_005239 [Bacillus wiedmannii]|uniref:hypothetical protein n=1 Tax=Bacillus wiedmannii TaxID=1890302 RepID=UPI000FEF7876|nr:hypothetical protein BCY92_04265 [Bacillus wiedmannii]
MGKGRSNNVGKKQPNFDDSSKFAKQSQPTEKRRNKKKSSLDQESSFLRYIDIFSTTYRSLNQVYPC